jgi:hypothetical protein
LVALPSDFLGRFICRRQQKGQHSAGLLAALSYERSVRFASAAQAKTGEAETEQRERAGFGDPFGNGKDHRDLVEPGVAYGFRRN